MSEMSEQKSSEGLTAASGRELTVEDFLDELDARFKAEETEGWRTPANRTEREYTARQARMAVEELRYKIAEYNAAVAVEVLS